VENTTTTGPTRATDAAAGSEALARLI